MGNKTQISLASFFFALNWLVTPETSPCVTPGQKLKCFKLGLNTSLHILKAVKLFKKAPTNYRSHQNFLNITDTLNKKSRIRETPTLSTDADSRTNTNLKRLVDFFQEVA